MHCDRKNIDYSRWIVMEQNLLFSLIKAHYCKDERTFYECAKEIAEEYLLEGEMKNYYSLNVILSNYDKYSQDNRILNNYNLLFKTVSWKSISRRFPIPISLEKKVNNIIDKLWDKRISKFIFSGVKGSGKREACNKIALESQRDILFVRLNECFDEGNLNVKEKLDEVLMGLLNITIPKRILVIVEGLEELRWRCYLSPFHYELDVYLNSFLRKIRYLDDELKVILLLDGKSTLIDYSYLDVDFYIDFDAVDYKEKQDVVERVFRKITWSSGEVRRDDLRLFRKVLDASEDKKKVADVIENLTRACETSNIGPESDYLKNLYILFLKKDPEDIFYMKKKNFTLREIERISGKSKSNIGRILKKTVINE